MQRLLGGILFSTFFFLCAHNVHAASYHLAPSKPDVRIKESFSVVSVKLLQGERVESSVDIINMDDQEAKVYLLSNTNTKTPIELLTPDKAVTVPAKSRKTVPFIVKAGSSVNDGEYIYYLYASNNSKTKYSTNIPSLRVTATVGKKLEKKLEVTNSSFSFGSNSLIISTTLKNKGSTTIESLGIKLFMNGKIPFITSAEEFYWGETVKVPPGQTQRIVYKIPYGSPLFIYAQGHIEVDYGGKTTAQAINSIFYTNQTRIAWYAAGLLICFVALIYAIRSGILNLSIEYAKKYLSSVHIRFPFARNKDVTHFLHKDPAINTDTKNELAKTLEAETPKLESKINEVGIEGMVKNIMKEEEAIISAKELSYDKIFFEVRKIVRQEIELWKEIDKFRHEVREQLVREEQIKKRLKEELNKN